MNLVQRTSLVAGTDEPLARRILISNVELLLDIKEIVGLLSR